ncbi:MAG TPA: TonB-dependent receptor plug domain-containing protein, partial [Xanthobacteraceae bacterium]|nr:TonB-dependent receptor plug domain-containing protein [Xanthobacteraceae bacterium]
MSHRICFGRFAPRARFGAAGFVVLSLVAADPCTAQTAPDPPSRQHVKLPRVTIVAAPHRRHARRGTPSTAPADQRAPAPAPPAGPVEATTPLNTGTVASSASRLGLTARETPATVEVVDQQTMREQGYRTTAETANGAVGVLSVDAAGAPAGFSMRGFSFGEVNVLYNGISTGPQSITSRTLDTANLSQVEFLKGPSSLMTGLNAIGGSVNYVSREPTGGPIKSELDLSADSLGTVRSHYG